MKLLPSVDIDNPGLSGMTRKEAIVLASLSYASVIAFLPLLILALYNIYTFLIRQRKYKVYPLVLFYTLTLPCLLMRITVSIYIVPII